MTRLVVFCCAGLYQRHIVRWLARDHTVVGIVWYHPITPKGKLRDRLRRYLYPPALYRYVLGRQALAADHRQAAARRQQYFYPDGQEAALPDCPQIQVSNINDPATVAFVQKLQPELICVNGTNLLRGPLLDLIPQIPLGIINLHTGLSPYSRGGNCNLFMLLEGHPEWVGLTVHHIDKGIDSGNIILTAQLPLEVEDSFADIEAKEFYYGAKLLACAVTQLAAGQALRVKQWTEGKLFLRRTGYVYQPYQRWRLRQRLRAGLLADYLRDQSVRDRDVQRVGRCDAVA